MITLIFVFFIKEVSCSSSITISSRITLKKKIKVVFIGIKLLQKSSKPKEIQINSSSLSGEDHNSPLQLKEKINLKISFRLMWRILQRRQREIKKTFKQFMITFALFFMFIFMMVMLVIILDEMTNG